MARHLPEDRVQEVVEFLGELCAIPFSEEGSPRLRAARSDPLLMNVQVSRALVAFLSAECAQQPVLLVLEDLHWSDALTVKLVDEALGELAAQPFMVLALARPEVTELFPGLWSRRLHRLPLNGLSRKAGARLVREVLGAQVPEAAVQRAVEMSDGNALFLEELIRMVADGRGETVPETVLAVLQARLMRMEAGARQILLAASIFGRHFWPGGVAALLEHGAGETLERHLRHLVEQELVEPQPDSRFPGAGEYRFRHALVRDAAYALVPDNLRPTGHRMAGAWLERMGELDPLELATHYQRGHRPERAVHFYTQAATRLLERYDLQGARRYAEEALGCGIEGRALIPLRAILATVAFWAEDFLGSHTLGIFQMLALFPPYLLFARKDFVTFLLAQGRAEEARQVAMLGVEELERMGGSGVHAVPMYLALAEACFAEGDSTAGEAALREALQAVRTRADDIPEPEARERFLRQVPENARTLELAHQRWGGAAA